MNFKTYLSIPLFILASCTNNTKNSQINTQEPIFKEIKEEKKCTLEQLLETPALIHFDSVNLDTISFQKLEPGLEFYIQDAKTFRENKDLNIYLDSIIKTYTSNPKSLKPQKAVELSINITDDLLYYREVDGDKSPIIEGKRYNELSLKKQLELGYGDCNIHADATTQIFNRLKLHNHSLEHLHVISSIYAQACFHMWNQIVYRDETGTKIINYDITAPTWKNDEKELEQAGGYAFDLEETKLSYHNTLHFRMSLTNYKKGSPLFKNEKVEEEYKTYINNTFKELLIEKNESNNFTYRNLMRTHNVFTPEIKEMTLGLIEEGKLSNKEERTYVKKRLTK